MTGHRVDVVALVFGLLFLTTAGAWVAVEIGELSRSDLAWAAPVALIVAGTLGVLASLRR
ncbi:MAG: hypothetical protein M3419_10400 [Actinomycetota bacterium]|nr:hypothetical protein [Actinomycetota bacterium]